MRQIREVLRLYLLADLSSRKIQGATGVARTTVQDYIRRCKQSDITAQSLDTLNDDDLRVKLFGEQTIITVKSGKIMPDYNIIHQELYSKDLLELLFKHPYTKIGFLVEELGVSRKTAGLYLRAIEEVGILESMKVGRDVYFVNKRLFQLLQYPMKY